MRVFLDANILFSAARSAGAVREFLGRLEAGGHGLCADAYVVEEARRNLAVKGPDALAALERLLARLEIGAFRADSLPASVAERLREGEWPVFAAAVRLGCEVLLTGDRTHFGGLYGRRLLGVAVHSPRSLAEMLEL